MDKMRTEVPQLLHPKPLQLSQKVCHDGNQDNTCRTVRTSIHTPENQLHGWVFARIVTASRTAGISPRIPRDTLNSNGGSSAGVYPPPPPRTEAGAEAEANLVRLHVLISTVQVYVLLLFPQ